MDVNDWRNVVTVLSFFIFGGIVKWALSRRNQPGFDEAAMLPFMDEAIDGVAPARQEGRDE